MRGDYCTSADAAGLPISAHLFSADEIVVGRIQHAIRFILPNKHIRDSIYVHPATHSTSSPHGASGGSDAVPYGARLRLKSTTNLSGLNNSAKIVARALMKYGMILSDGGKITFTAMADDFTTAKWAQVGLGPNDLKSLRWSDFEMVEGGTRYNVKNGDCQHQTDTEVIGAPHAYPTKHTSTTFRIWRPN
jgi:serine/threonine-protein kinase